MTDFTRNVDSLINKHLMGGEYEIGGAWCGLVDHAWAVASKMRKRGFQVEMLTSDATGELMVRFVKQWDVDPLSTTYDSFITRESWYVHRVDSIAIYLAALGALGIEVEEEVSQ